MGSTVIMPSSGQTSGESLVTYWYKKAGDAVRRGEALFSIETDKATMDVESAAEGVLLAIYHGADEVVAEGEPMAYIGAAGELPPGAAQAEPVQSGPAQAVTTAAANAVSEASSVVGSAALASPAARRLARENGLSIVEVAGKSCGGPVKKADVMKALECSVESGDGEISWSEASAMRKAIARRMTESAFGAPQYIVSIDVDMGNAIALRENLNEHLKSAGIRVSYHDIIMKCACAAVEKHPIVNASYIDDKIRTCRHVHFGLAVGLENGLVVPVIRNADTKGIAQIAAENALHIEKARSGELKQEDMTGGTITLTNLGMYGVTSFTAILNRPESCILATGGIIEKPVVKDGSLAVGRVMNVTATFDHRLIDGATGAALLHDLKLLLENTELLLL